MFSKNIKILTLMLICASVMVSVIGMVSAVDPSQTGTADVNISGSGDSCFNGTVNIVDNVSIGTASGNIHGNVDIVNSEVKNGSSVTVANGTVVNASYTSKNGTNYFNSTHPTVSTDGFLYNYDSATNTYTSISDYVSTVFVGTVDNNGSFNGTLLINDNATGNKFQPFNNNIVYYVLMKISDNAAAYDENGFVTVTNSKTTLNYLPVTFREPTIYLDKNSTTVSYGDNWNFSGVLYDENSNILGNKSIFIAYTFNGNDTKIANVSTKSDGSYYFDSNIWYEQTNTSFKANNESTYRIVLTYYYGDDESHAYPILNVSSETNGTDIVSTNLSINDFSEIVGAGQNLTGKLLDSNGNPVIGQYIALNLTNPLNGASKIYMETTDTNGEYQLEINLFAGNYTASASYAGFTTKDNKTSYLASGPVNASIIVTSKPTPVDNRTSTALTVVNYTGTYSNPENLTGTLKTLNGNPIINQKVALNLTNPLNGASKIYMATTDTNGEYQLEINLAPGKYTVKSAFTGNDLYKSANDVSGTITVKS